MRIFSFLFLPELGRAFGEATGTLCRLGLIAGAMLPAARARDISWRRLAHKRHAARLVLAAALVAAGAAILFDGPDAAAQQTTIDGSLFQAEDDETRAILSFLHDLPVDTGSVVLADMLRLFNGGILVLAGVLLVWQIAAGALDTARQGRWGFGGWQIVRVVTAVALMAPLAGGLNGAQHIVLGLANLGGDFATAVWSPFTADILSPTRSIAPGRGPQAIRTIIGRALVLEVCLASANAGGSALVERETVAEALPPRTTTRYAGATSDVPPEGCGAIVYDGHGTTVLDGFLVWPWEEGADPPPVDYELAQVAAGRVPAAHYHALNTELAPAIRSLAADIAARFVPGSPTYGDPLPDADATLGPSGLEAAYTRILGDALSASRRDQDEAMRELAETYAEESSWLWAATFFHTLAWQTGRFETAAAETPEIRLPTESLTQWSPTAAAAVRQTLAWLSASNWPPVAVATTASVAQGTASTDFSDLFGALIHFVPIDWTVMASADNPILSLASLGFWLMTGALAAIGSLAAIAVANSSVTAIPIIGKALNVFATTWPILDGFVTVLLSGMLLAGLVLAYLLPAVPFIRFLFGILTWMLSVIEAVLAITIFAAAHITREDADTLVTRQTRLGWLFLPGLVLRPVLMIFGLVLGYFAFKAIISLLNAVWVPLMQISHAQAGASPLGFLAMLAIYTIVAWTACNACFKLIDILPTHVLTWIGGAAGIDAGGTEGAGIAAVGAASRAGAVTTPGFMGRMGRNQLGRLHRQRRPQLTRRTESTTMRSFALAAPAGPAAPSRRRAVVVVGAGGPGPGQGRGADRRPRRRVRLLLRRQPPAPPPRPQGRGLRRPGNRLRHGGVADDRPGDRGGPPDGWECRDMVRGPSEGLGAAGPLPGTASRSDAGGDTAAGPPRLARFRPSGPAQAPARGVGPLRQVGIHVEEAPPHPRGGARPAAGPDRPQGLLAARRLAARGIGHHLRAAQDRQGGDHRPQPPVARRPRPVGIDADHRSPGRELLHRGRAGAA